ncbi:STAS domain-containing protein [Pseudonocardia sp. CA-107938]|uniref:STAS domain-containing protein n=1 Tax=Pseudonocardia sp. CA-107938 TaxID=3240021 RepID=UPI003D9293AD
MALVSQTTHVIVSPDSAPARPRVAVVGEIDLASAGVFAAELAAVLDRQPVTHLTVDLSCVGFLAAAGAGVLIDLVEETARRGIGLEIRCAPTGTAATVLRLCGLSVAAVA